MHERVIKGVMQSYNITFEELVFNKNMSSSICTQHELEFSVSCNYSLTVVHE